MIPEYKNLERMARQQEDANWDFRNFLKFQDIIDYDELDDLVREITERVWANIDCKACGNCCKKVGPLLSEADQDRIAGHLNISVDKFQAEYLVFDKEEQSWEFKDKPCRFLKDNICTIYDVRPENCRDYPYLYKEDFSFRTMAMIGRTFVCPIVYEVLNELRSEIDFLKTQKMYDFEDEI